MEKFYLFVAVAGTTVFVVQFLMTIAGLNAESDVAVESSSRARMKIWTSNGVLVEEMMIENGYNLVGKQILNGVYLFEFIFEDGLREIKQVIF